MKKNQYFYCYSPVLKKYLEKMNINYVDKGFNDTTQKNFWVYKQTLTLGVALKAYTVTKELFAQN